MWCTLAMVASAILALSAAVEKSTLPVPTSCPPVNNEGYTVHLAHETDCTQFYVCDNGVKIQMGCAPGTHFNPVLQVCDMPERAGCVAKPLEVKEGSERLRQENRGEEFDRVVDLEEERPKCPIGSQNLIARYTHPTNCSHYYECDDDGNLLEASCPWPLNYNPELEECDSSNQADCGCCGCCHHHHHYPPHNHSEGWLPTTTTPRPSHGPWDPRCPPPGPLNYTVHLPHPTNCNKFYKCDNGHLVEFSCPANLHFNPKLQVCDWPDQAGCIPNHHQGHTTTTTNPTTTSTPLHFPQPVPCRPGLNLPHECDSALFYHCVNGQRILYRCPRRHSFNYETGRCECSGCRE